MNSQQFSYKEYCFLLQGVKALQQETAKQKTAVVQRMFPEDNNLNSLVEYYDKRSVELHHLETKILGTVST